MHCVTNANTNRRLMGPYRHLPWMPAAGRVVVVTIGGLSVLVLVEQVGELLR